MYIYIYIHTYLSDLSQRFQHEFLKKEPHIPAYGDSNRDYYHMLFGIPMKNSPTATSTGIFSPLDPGLPQIPGDFDG